MSFEKMIKGISRNINKYIFINSSIDITFKT